MCNSAINYSNRPNEKCVKFQKYSSCSCYMRADASKLTSLTSSTWGYMYAKQTKAKKSLLRRMKVKLRAAVFWFLNDMKGQGVTYITQVTCFENILRFRSFSYPKFFRPMCSWNDWSSPECSLVRWSHVPKCFLSLEFRLNTGKNCACVTVLIVV